MYSSREFVACIYSQGNKTLNYRDENENIEFNVMSVSDYKTLTCKKEIVGYVKRNNHQASKKEYANLYLYKNTKEYVIDVYGKKPKLTCSYGYLKVDEGKYLEVVKRNFIFLWLILLLICLALIGCLFLKKTASPIEETKEPIIEEIIKEEKINAYLTLPSGEMSFDGKVAIADQQAKLELTIINEQENTLLQKEVAITEGGLPDLTIDFEKLNYELIPGIYKGKIYLELSDEATKEYDIDLLIRESSGGTVGVGYSDEVIVDLTNKKVKLNYHQGPSSNSAIVEVILIQNNQECILATSEEIGANEDLKELELKNANLSKGNYQGLLRITFLSDNQNLANIKSDIEVTIKVN